MLEAELSTLYEVSQMLGRSLDLHRTLRDVLITLHERDMFRFGMITVADKETGDLAISASVNADSSPRISYQQGEGIVGVIMESGETITLPRIKDEPRFLGKRGVYDPELPFIGVPLFDGAGSPFGVFAAQPPGGDDHLADYARFMEMIATLIAQTVRLLNEVETQKAELTEERDTLRREVRNRHGFDQIIGQTREMREIFEQVRLVAKWNTTVLVRGESGTGKELIASAIHYNSTRHSGPFVKLNCAALPDTLLESELFGHEKGSFTGAVNQRKGRFEQADGGTIFLDEIGEISPAFQAKLLRILQEGEFERIGGMKTLKVDIRVIAATNRDLEQEVAEGNFREDLYYRLNVMPVNLPALRERVEDIPELANFLLAKLAARQGRVLTISDPAIRSLMRYPWPGNVRELENYVERAAILSETGAIEAETIEMMGLGRAPGAPVMPKPSMASNGNGGFEPPQPPAAAGNASYDEDPLNIDLENPDLDERERVIAALEKAGWVQAKAARLLNMTPRQIAYRIKTLNINVRQF
ncbi:MAG: nif-specific transcriptional activator NifA [Magnetovibrionaceae bacterium]